MATEKNFIYQTANCVDGMNPLNYFDPAEIAARLNLMFNRYMSTESNADELKANHWLISCINDHFHGVCRRDEYMPNEE